MSFISLLFNKFMNQYAEPLGEDFVKFGLSDGIEINDLIIKPDAINSKLEGTDIDMRVEYGRIGNMRAVWTALPGIITLQIKDLDIRLRPNLADTAFKQISKKIKEIQTPEEEPLPALEAHPYYLYYQKHDLPVHDTRANRVARHRIPRPPQLVHRAQYMSPMIGRTSLTSIPSMSSSFPSNKHTQRLYSYPSPVFESRHANNNTSSCCLPNSNNDFSQYPPPTYGPPYLSYGYTNSNSYVVSSPGGFYDSNMYAYTDSRGRTKANDNTCDYFDKCTTATPKKGGRVRGARHLSPPPSTRLTAVNYGSSPSRPSAIPPHTYSYQNYSTCHNTVDHTYGQPYNQLNAADVTASQGNSNNNGTLVVPPYTYTTTTTVPPNLSTYYPSSSTFVPPPPPPYLYQSGNIPTYSSAVPVQSANSSTAQQPPIYPYVSASPPPVSYHPSPPTFQYAPAHTSPPPSFSYANKDSSNNFSSCANFDDKNHGQGEEQENNNIKSGDSNKANVTGDTQSRKNAEETHV